MDHLIQINVARLACHALKGLTDKAGEPMFDHARQVAWTQHG